VFRNFIVDSATNLTHPTGQPDFSNDGNHDDDPHNDLGCISCILRLCHARNFTMLRQSWVWRHRLLPLCGDLQDMGDIRRRQLRLLRCAADSYSNYSTDLWLQFEPDFRPPRHVWHSLSRSYFHALCAEHMEKCLNTARSYPDIHVLFLLSEPLATSGTPFES
jgi:hypothetical protein